MRALILTGGLGTRLMPLTKETPKCLIKFGDKTILSQIVDSLLACGIKEIIFLNTRRNFVIEKYIARNYPSLRTSFLYDPEDKNPNWSYIYPLSVGRDLLVGDDVIFLHGDVFLDRRLVEKLVNFQFSAALVHKDKSSSKDFNVKVENGLITQIGVKVAGDSVRFCLPVYKFLKDDFSLWIEAVRTFVENGLTSCYAEDALNPLLARIRFYPLYFDKEYGLEIDDLEDLKTAEDLLAKLQK